MAAADRKKAQDLPAWVRGPPLAQGCFLLTVKIPNGLRVMMPVNSIGNRCFAWNTPDALFLADGEVLAHHPLQTTFMG